MFHLRGAGLERAELRRLLEPFLADGQFHTQISAARALSVVGSDARLCKFIAAEREGFAKIMAVWGLRDRGTEAGKKCLEAYLPKADTDETGFGGNIMDPRVGTRFPGSVKAAVKEAIGDWPAPGAAPIKPAPTRAAPANTRPSPATAPKQQGCGHCSSGGSGGPFGAALFGLAIAALFSSRRRRHHRGAPSISPTPRWRPRRETDRR